MNKETINLLGEVLRHTSSRVKRGSSFAVFSPEFHQQVSSAYKQDNVKLAKRSSICADFCKDFIPGLIDQPKEDAGTPEELVKILLERLISNQIEERNL